MTSDAKIGLLLGLGFIFAIAFMINGLPSTRGQANNNELTTNMIHPHDDSPGLAAKERKATEVISRIEPAKKQPPVTSRPTHTTNQDVRFKTSLPQSPSFAKDTLTAEKNQIHKPKPVKSVLPRFYIINEGDSLATIAKKFYGPEDGNKHVNITRIFQANAKLLSSPDEIYEGQKLIIPALSGSTANRGRTNNILASPMLEKVKSIGMRHLSTDGHKTKRTRQYTVQEGDSLWLIAAERLGDGCRYADIAKLNAGVIDDQDNLAVGMRLKLPAQ